MDNFLKLNTQTNFFKGVVPLKPIYYTVVVVYLDGFKKEYPGIENPHQYISKIKKNPKVKSAFIRD